MKAILSKTAGVNKTMQGHHKAVSAAKALPKGEKSFSKQHRKLGSAKSESKQSNSADKTKHSKDHIKTHKQDRKKEQTDKKIVPFSLIVSQANLKTTTAAKAGEKAKTGIQKTSKKTNSKEKQQKKVEVPNTDKEIPKTDFKNTGKSFSPEVSDQSKDTAKTTNNEHQPVVNKESKKKNKTKSTNGSKSDSKNKMTGVEKEGKNNPVSKYVISNGKHAKAVTSKRKSKVTELTEKNPLTVKKFGDKQAVTEIQQTNDKRLAKKLEKVGKNKQKIGNKSLRKVVPDKPDNSKNSKAPTKKGSQNGTFLQQKATSNTNITANKLQQNGHTSSLIGEKMHMSTSHDSKGASFQSSTDPSGNPENSKNQQYTPGKNGQNGVLAHQKPSFKGNILPGKIHADRFSPLVNKMVNMKTSGKTKGKSNNSSDDTSSSGMKLASPTDAAGRKAFGQQFAQQISQSFTQQMQSSSKQAAVWKHHRLQLQNGKSIHIAARNSNGVLQLQLQAGNDQLGKILQQHLQEIQQHVQQQLNIDINLHLHDFGEQQQSRQYEEPSSLKQSKDEVKTDERISAVDLHPAAGSQQVRYFGFNQNEWTA
jgi:hypothetical protein